MGRKRIEINEILCNGCGLCVTACHEGAIALVEGKARLLKAEHCDGLGDCLPICPTGAITLTESDQGRPAESLLRQAPAETSGGRAYRRVASGKGGQAVSRLAQWPCQIRLVPPRAPYFENADLLIAADCSAYACGELHERYMRGRITLIGCPKLDKEDYAERLTTILRENSIRSLLVVCMEVPCCRGLERAVRAALAAVGGEIPCEVVTLTTDGRSVKLRA